MNREWREVLKALFWVAVLLVVVTYANNAWGQVVMPTPTTVVVDAGAAGETVCTGAIWTQTDLGSAPWDTGRYSLISGTTPLTFTCQVPIVNGFYTVDLQLIEPNKMGAGQRVFNVTANGGQVTQNIDVFKESGGQKKQYDVRMFVAVSNGVLRLDFRPVVGNAYVAGFVVTPFLGGQSFTVNNGSAQLLPGKYVDVFDEDREAWKTEVLSGGKEVNRSIPIQALTGNGTWQLLFMDGNGNVSGAPVTDAGSVGVPAQQTSAGTWQPTANVPSNTAVAVYLNGTRLGPEKYVVYWPNKLTPPQVTIPGSVATDVVVLDYYVYGIVNGGQLH